MSTDASQLADQFGELVRQVSYLARTRVHKISPRQIAVLSQLSERSLVAMKIHLERQPVDQQVAAQVRDWESTRWAAQDQAIAAVHAGAVSPYAKAGGAPASDEPNSLHVENEDDQTPVSRTQAPARRVPEADRPQEAGYFLHEGRMYKVVRAIYGSGHLYAKRLDEAKGEWVKATGMTSYLREDERMTEAQAIEYSRKLEITPEMKIYGKCTLCGRALTDETSIANRVGPGPHAGLAD